MITVETIDMDVACNVCHDHFTLTVNTKDIIKWQQGTLIQDALDYLSDDERELLISNTCGPCFDHMFADDEE